MANIYIICAFSSYIISEGFRHQTHNIMYGTNYNSPAFMGTNEFILYGRVFGI